MAFDKAREMTLSRSVTKLFIKKIFIILVMPIYALYFLISRGGKKDSVFHGFSQAISLVPGIIGIYIRAAFYRLACTGTSDNISVGFLTILSHIDTTIEPGVYIGPQCNIGKCIIRENTLIGSGVHILSGRNQHYFFSIDSTIKSQGGKYTKISIGSDCWLGNQSTIMSSVP